jgi:hypothetical protein
VSWSRVGDGLEKATGMRLESEKVKGMECELE